jgi:glucose-6-phosphate isomerase
LKFHPEAYAEARGRSLRFLANVDPVDVARALDGLDPAETLVVVVSKTFTTAETMLNARTAREWLLKGISGAEAASVVSHHMIAVSAAPDKAKAFGIDEKNVFGFWDWVGGRYSVCSSVGVVPLALQYGTKVVQDFLTGAREMDEHFFTAPLPSNLPVLLALVSVWNHSFLGYTTRAILPYSQALLRFPAHIQQVSMESNGKRVASDGSVLEFEAGEIIFGEPGTNGQHSFYQLIHQGRVIPCDFIGVCKSQHPILNKSDTVSNHDELMSNFFAQPDALAKGKSADDLKKENVPQALISHKTFPGDRPSISLLLPELDARRIGQLLALYENQVAAQGFIWGVNSFDQWGVELGKVLATQVRNEIAAARKDSRVKVSGNEFCPSTKALMEKFLSAKQ